MRDRRHTGRQERKRQRFRQWLASEACEEIRLIDKNLYDSFDGDYEPCMALALARAIGPGQLRQYLKMKAIYIDYNVIRELEDVAAGKPESEQVMVIVKEIENRSRKSGLTLQQVAHEAIFNVVNAVVAENPAKVMPWVDYGLCQLEAEYNNRESEWYLGSEMSFLFCPELGNTLRAIGRMGLTGVLLDFVKWNRRLRHHIASELDVAPGEDYINFNYGATIPVLGKLTQEDWETVRRVVILHLHAAEKSITAEQESQIVDLRIKRH